MSRDWVALKIDPDQGQAQADEARSMKPARRLPAISTSSHLGPPLLPLHDAYSPRRSMKHGESTGESDGGFRVDISPENCVVLDPEVGDVLPRVGESDCFQEWNAYESQPSARFFHAPGGVQVSFPGIATFDIPFAAGAVRCLPVASGDDRWRAIFEQQVVPLILADRGAAIFHGGAVVVDGGAVALLAPSGRGKSTLTAACAARGLPFLGDDCLHLDFETANGSHSPIMVRPQPAFVRVWDDTLTEVSLPGVVSEHPDGFPKPRLIAGVGLPHCPEPMPLRAAFVITDDVTESVSIQAVSASAALMTWVTNAFVLDITHPDTLRRVMVTAATLARAVPMSRLSYPRRYDALPEVVAALLQHLRRNAGTDGDS